MGLQVVPTELGCHWYHSCVGAYGCVDVGVDAGGSLLGCMGWLEVQRVERWGLQDHVGQVVGCLSLDEENLGDL